MDLHHYICSPNVLGLRTNVPDFKWSWASGAPESTSQEYDDCSVKMECYVEDTPNHTQASSGKYHYFSGEEGADLLRYRRTLVGRRQIALEVSGLLAGRPTLRVNPGYLRFIRHRFMNLHSAGYILTDIAALMLLKAGYCPLHCSGFSIEGRTVLVLAPPNTGKTLSTMMACMEYNALYLAEDLAVTDGAELFSVPWTSTFRYYDRVDASRYSKALNRATEKLPVLELLPLGRTDRVDQLVHPDSLVHRAKVTDIVILERGPETVIQATEEEALRKAVNLNRYEFNYLRSPALIAYEFFNPGIELLNSHRSELNVLAQLVSRVQNRFVVRSQDATRYAQLIMGALDLA